MALAIEDITYRIRNQGGDIDSAMAKFAVQAYAARNQVCHGEAGHLVITEKWDDLAQRISLDLAVADNVCFSLAPDKPGLEDTPMGT
jgi:hypothetical protein